MDRLRKVEELVRSDPHAPLYHFIAPEGKCLPFDPNGALFWKGKYHLFYIFQDPELPHGGHCWGHASSADLLHWDYHPTALAPAPGDPDVGIFSGCAFVSKEGVPTIAYHGVSAGTCLAFAEDDDLVHWRKSPHNPVIPDTKEGGPGWGVYNVFDPHMWLEDGAYYVILGGRVKPHDLYDTAYLFRSDDLVNWQYLRPFYNPNPTWTGEEEDCACPDFFKIGDRHALVCISHARGARYYLGRWQDGTFVPEEHHRMNWPGGSCFAPETLLDGQGRRVFWAWVVDQRRCEGLMPNELGVMTMPRILSLDEHGKLLIDPPEEFESLRRNARDVESLAVAPEQEIYLNGIGGSSMELSTTVRVPENGQFGLKVRVSPDGCEETVILYDRREATISIDTNLSSLSPEVFQRYPVCRGPQEDIRVQTAPLALEPGEPLSLRVFMDKSIIEVYANRRQCVTQMVYPTREDSLGVAVFSRNGESVVDKLIAWQMASTNVISSEAL